MECPFCKRTHQRVLGGIILLTPGMVDNPDKAPIAGRACNNCLGVIAKTLDLWMNGGINNFIAKLEQNKLIRAN